MLTYVDTLIGFAGVMLLLSLLVTAVVQAAIASLNLRGRNLRWGVALLVGKALPKLEGDKKKTNEIAKRILKDPTLSTHWRMAKAIRSDELIRLLPAYLGSDVRQASRQGREGRVLITPSPARGDVGRHRSTAHRATPHAA